MSETRAKLRFRFSLKTLLVFAFVAGVVLAMFYLRAGSFHEGCPGEGKEAIWVSTPSDGEIIEEFKRQNPQYQDEEEFLIIKTKTLEELDGPFLFPFLGRKWIHRVRIECSVFLPDDVSKPAGSVAFNLDHFHMNGGGFDWIGEEPPHVPTAPH